MTVHVISAPNPYKLALATTFSGVTPYADAYASKHTDAPDALEKVLLNAPPDRRSPAASTGTSTAHWSPTW